MSIDLKAICGDPLLELKKLDSNSIDERMKRVLNDLNDAGIRENYIKNHIAWFLKNHKDATDEFMKEVQEKYYDKMKETNQLYLFEMYTSK